MKELLFDHLVHYTELPKNAQEEFQSLGFKTVTGGQHPNWGTHNTLCFFQELRYIEWIGFSDFQMAKESDNVLIQQIVEDHLIGEGFVQFAVRTYDIKKLAASFKQKGLETIGPFEGNRKRADGTFLSWSMLFLEDDNEEGFRYPFFIQWGESENIRYPQFRSYMEHENQAKTIDFIGIAVNDIDKAVEQYSQLFSLQEKKREFFNDEFGTYKKLKVAGITIRFYEARFPEWKGKLGKPCLCGISGTKQTLIKKLHNSYYQFIE